MPHPYCQNSAIGKRLLMTDTQIASDSTNLTDAANEASRLVDLFIGSKAVTPLVTVPSIIADITADFGASIRKRKYSPTEQKIPNMIPLGNEAINQEASGWYAIGLIKLKEYIKTTYGSGKVSVIKANSNWDSETPYTW